MPKRKSSKNKGATAAVIGILSVAVIAILIAIFALVSQFATILIIIFNPRVFVDNFTVRIVSFIGLFISLVITIKSSVDSIKENSMKMIVFGTLIFIVAVIGQGMSLYYIAADPSEIASNIGLRTFLAIGTILFLFSTVSVRTSESKAKKTRQKPVTVYI